MAAGKPSIVFMGTPEFAVPSLEILVRNGFPVKAVVTAGDKPAGRGLKVREPAVKIAAKAHGIPVLQPSNLKDDEFAGKLRDLSADFFVVVAFRMLPEKVWSMPPKGTINLHASLLPLYRGAAPINHAIINGEKVTGVTTFFIEKEIDKGNIILQKKTEIDDYESAGELHDRLMILGAELLLETIESVSEDRVEPVSQDEFPVPENLPLAPKISKSDCRIDWSESAANVYNFIRGLSPYPAAWTIMVSEGREVKIKILHAEKTDDTHAFPPGKIIGFNDDLLVATGEGSIRVKFIQAEGKRAMPSSEFLRGFRPGAGSCFK